MNYLPKLLDTLIMTLQPVVQDQYVAARLYFGSVVGLFFLEGLLRIGLYLKARFFKPSVSYDILSFHKH